MSIFSVKFPFPYEHLFCKKKFRRSAGKATKGMNVKILKRELFSSYLKSNFLFVKIPLFNKHRCMNILSGYTSKNINVNASDISAVGTSSSGIAIRSYNL